MKSKLKKTITIFVTLIFSLQLNNCANEVIDPSIISGKTYGGKEPAWSPDGNRIAFIGGINDEEYGIYDININGEDLRRISVPEFAGSPDWSPDGNWIVYTKGGDIYKKKLADDSVIVQLTFNGGNYFPSWSKDGQWIAFDSNADSPNGMHFVWKMRTDGTERRRIIYSPETGEVRQPDWFPDGIRLAVARFVGHGGPEIAIIDTMGNSLALLTNDGIFDRSPRVSNDGLYIVFEKDGNWGQIFRIKADGSELFRVSEGNSTTPDWSPDGNRITYSSYEPQQIFVIDRNGFLKRKL